MKIFLDTHIIINAFVYNDAKATSVVNFISTNHSKPVISSLTVAILNYYLDKKYRKTSNKKKAAKLLDGLFEMSTPLHGDVAKMLLYDDWEDAFQYFSALQCNCELIVTDNYYDYYFSKIKLMSVNEFESTYF